ncbi:hypothetical protein Clacol_001843 [Clathrus columnatus]|uniref:Carboxylesterase type B domain-containing protein n=1 Tax=Clathrus columnatus TaxID=1419009 RepID=A0AAV5A2Z7_9AGAM|nr:hypothetical protein Clacol_001843 [Clathrus columnatus]
MHLLAAQQHPEMLFHGAIGISPFFPAQLSHKGLDWQFNVFENRTGCLSSGDVLECLQQKTPVELANANRKMAYPGHEADEDNNYCDAALAPWTPCIDDDLIVDTPLTLFEIGQFHKIPMIWGSNTDEGSLFVTNATFLEEVVKFIQANFHKLTPEEVRNIVAEYPVEGFKKGKAAYFLSNADAYGDAVLGCPGYELVNFMAPYANTWYYQYDVLTNEEEEAGVGVFHMADLPALFGENNVHPRNQKPRKDTYTMSPILRSYFTNFVCYLNPNASPVLGSIL